jgi:phosphoribosylanthranilate isomerase
MNEEQLDAVLADPTNLHALLLDTFVAATPGGTGRIADWDLAAEIVCRSKHPVILAGGLTPDNVATAIRTVRPQGVDVASGVEDAPDRKSPTLLRQFVLAAVSTFTNLGPEPGQPTR